MNLNVSFTVCLEDGEGESAFYLMPEGSLQVALHENMKFEGEISGDLHTGTFLDTSRVDC